MFYKKVYNYRARRAGVKLISNRLTRRGVVPYSLTSRLISQEIRTGEMQYNNSFGPCLLCMMKLKPSEFQN